MEKVNLHITSFLLEDRNTDTKWSLLHRDSFGEKLTKMEG